MAGRPERASLASFCHFRRLPKTAPDFPPTLYRFARLGQNMSSESRARTGVKAGRTRRATRLRATGTRSATGRDGSPTPIRMSSRPRWRASSWPALKHHTRRGGRAPERCQMSSERVTHALLRDAGFSLPPDAQARDGLSVEEAYDRLPEPQEDESGGDGDPPPAGSNADAGAGAACGPGDGDPAR